MVKKPEFPDPTALFAEAAALAAQPWDRLEAIFDQRVARAMSRLGMPTAAEFADLQRQIDELASRLDALEKRAARKPPAKKS